VKDDLIEMLRSMRRAEREVFGSLEASVRDAPIRTGDWSPKDHQAHLTAWKARHARRFAAAREGVELPAVSEGDETDELNAELRAERADWTWEAVVTEADEVTDQLESEIAATDPELIASSHRLIGGTLGNGPFHAMSHFGWLVGANVGVDADRVSRYVEEVVEQFRSSRLPTSAVANAIYNAACYRALHEELDVARGLLREAFQLDADLISWSQQDADLVELRDELDELAAGVGSGEPA
jgi:hypothetical protein